jgi:hypothetical protein
MKQFKIKFKSDNLIELNGTVDEAAQTAITLASGAGGNTCVARIFDDSKDAAVTIGSISGDNFLNVSDVTKLEVGDNLYIELDDGTYYERIIAAIDTTTKIVGLTATMTIVVSPGRLVSVMLGASVSMLEYGTPVVGQYDWGWRGVIGWNRPELRVGQSLRIEITLDGGTNLVLRQDIRALVDGGM